MLLVPLISLISSHALGDDSQTLKVMFFGDDVVAGVHNADVDICPFRYEFLRSVRQMGMTVEVVGTNSDKETTCQKLGEDLDPHNNGYRNSGTYELLDYIAADLKYLHKPADYIFTSIGMKDCLKFQEGGDFQIVSQSIRRVMGRLLNLNEKAKIVHLPILLPETAGATPVECMKFVNEKLREVYDFDKNHDHIQVVKLQNEIYDSDSFFKIGEVKPKATEPPVVVESETPVVDSVITNTKLESPVAAEMPSDTQSAKNEEVDAPMPAGDIEMGDLTVIAEPATTPVVEVKANEVTLETPISKELPSDVTSPRAEEVEASAPVYEAEKVELEDESTSGVRRRVDIPLTFLPKPVLVKEIITILIEAVDFEFRAQTLHPTLEVTKEPDYYGYDWCMSNYEEDECFEYYYGYSWCTENYGDDECYNYYYGDVDEWSDEESYKWCLNLYDEEFCSFAYLGEEPDTWDWLSFGYHDCLEEYGTNECFDQYYGYAWCLNEYDDEDCYEYYYGGDDWTWDEESSYKWCINFYSEDDCSSRYIASYNGEIMSDNVTNLIAGAGLVALLAGCVWLSWKKLTWCKNCGKKSYSRLETRGIGVADEVESLF